jgi:hypothetical protein
MGYPFGLSAYFTSGGSSLSTPVSIANGGTGSATKNFVDLTTAQTVAGAKLWAAQVQITNSGSSSESMTIDSSTNGTKFDTSLGGSLTEHQVTYNLANTWSIFVNNAMTFVSCDSRPAVSAITFPTNSGFPFPATLNPSGTTQTVDWTSGTSQIVNAASTSGTLVLTFSNPVNGGRYVLETVGLTGRTWTFPSAVKWAGGTPPTVTALTGAIDMFEFYYDGSIYVGRIIAQHVS